MNPDYLHPVRKTYSRCRSSKFSFVDTPRPRPGKDRKLVPSSDIIHLANRCWFDRSRVCFMVTRSIPFLSQGLEPWFGNIFQGEMTGPTLWNCGKLV
ncbi:hypothetical protein BDQ94DRAFT_128168 [Aspergillus welwitschiae]|uniref:Uncharacterized protein n=1 Tax=Aspergillus welwitschiae TaxID=1341132 RepID=A0A3F3Q8J4_9EURO|nr:hypothetical protein BDQ94DRAFT_128168 [Aspergillus welwitschiae]RDH35449.1 hypothetical protein BDQ94DRAFT_128168 [Aspergillus welwitschiae]